MKQKASIWRVGVEACAQVLTLETDQVAPALFVDIFVFLFCHLTYGTGSELVEE